jgi:predicted N-acyltransferase
MLRGFVVVVENICHYLAHDRAFVSLFRWVAAERAAVSQRLIRC